MTRIRLTFVIPTLDQSGAEKQLTLLATHLPQDRFEINVIALNRGGFYENDLQSVGIPVHVLHKRSRIDLQTHFRLRSLLNKLQPDVVHSWLFAANTHVRLLKTSRQNWKCIVSERCVDSWKAGWQLFLDRSLISRTDALLANSESVAEFYRQQKIPPQLLHVIPNGIVPLAEIDRNSAEYQRERRQWLQRWGFPEDAYVIGYIGRLAPQKKLQTLLWAMHMLKLSEPNVRAMIVGEGPERAALQDLAVTYESASHVTFAGHQQDAVENHRFWDAFWLASDFEGQSNSLLEAMSAGLPVVASDIPPNRELILPEQTGMLVPVDDAAGFALAIRKLIAQPDWARQMGESARQFVTEERSVEQMVSRHVACYEMVMSKKVTITSSAQ